jgi:hypothetical protein
MEKTESNKPMSTLEKINLLEQTVVRLERRVMGVNSPTLEYLIGEFEKLKLQLANVAKTVSATTGLLASKKILDGSEIMEQIRKMDEKHSKEEIQQLLSSGIISATELVDSNSVVGLAVEVIESEGSQPVKVSEYTKVDLSSYPDGDVTKSALVGAKIGDKVKVQGDNSVVVIYEVLESYSINSNGSMSESETPNESSDLAKDPQ